jgi:4'-phosphopantetheinyl transferase EntD
MATAPLRWRKLIPSLLVASRSCRAASGGPAASTVLARTAPAFARLFEVNLRHGFCVGVGLDSAAAAPAGWPRVGAADAAAHPLDLLAAESMRSESRLASFCGGRAALRLGLRSCGLAHDGPIGREPSGAPVLPVGALASISHTRGLAASLVAPARPGVREALGLDVEAVGRACSPRLAERVLSAAERAHVEAEAAAGSPAQAGVLLRFSLKEALYKALHRLGAHDGVLFRDVSLSPRLDGTAACEWADTHRAHADAWAVELTWAVLADYYVATAHVRQIGS